MLIFPLTNFSAILIWHWFINSIYDLLWHTKIWLHLNLKLWILWIGSRWFVGRQLETAKPTTNPYYFYNQPFHLLLLEILEQHHDRLTLFLRRLKKNFRKPNLLPSTRFALELMRFQVRIRFGPFQNSNCKGFFFCSTKWTLFLKTQIEN